MQWLKWWTGAATDPKLRLIAQRSKRPLCEVLSVWVMVLELAAQGRPKGVVSGWDSEAVSVHLDMEESHVEAIIEAFRARGMLDGWVVASWDQRQAVDRTAAERKRRQRERVNGNGSAEQEQPESRQSRRDSRDNRDRQRVNGKAKSTVPSCPYEEIIALYHEILPELPPVVEWDADQPRAKQLRSRWRERRERQDIEWWRQYFQHVRQFPFLMGESKGWRADLEFLTRKSKMPKILEGGYAND